MRMQKANWDSFDKWIKRCVGCEDSGAHHAGMAKCVYCIRCPFAICGCSEDFYKKFTKNS